VHILLIIVSIINPKIHFHSYLYKKNDQADE